MSIRFRRVHIMGASGAGTTTLGAALAREMDGRHLDTDAFYWVPTDPPFEVKRPTEERLAMLRAAFAEGEPWVLSGSLIHWGVELAAEFDLVVFLFVPPEERMARTLAREQGRYGARIEPGGDMRESHLKFMDWSRGYDTSTQSVRNLAGHRAWLAELTCPVLEIAGTPTVEESLARVRAA